MGKNTKLLFTGTVMSSLALLGFGRKPRPQRVICGGTTDRTDHDAPKFISSKEIVSFSASFYLEGEWSVGRSERQYHFRIVKDENGLLTATEDETGVSFEADKELLDSLQEIIDKYGLVYRNGVYRVTAGLPPPYQKCSLSVDYASGEKLSFTENNNPTDEWIKKVYLAFAHGLARKGDDTLLPPQTAGRTEKLSICIREGDLTTRILPMLVRDEKADGGKRLLLNRYVYSDKEKKRLSDRFAAFPDDYYEKIDEILGRYDLRTFDKYSVLFGLDRKVDKDLKSEDADIELSITYEGGHRLHILTSDADDKRKLKPLLDEISAYDDTLFDAQQNS